MAAIQFNQQAQGVREGVPFSWGTLQRWYMKTTDGTIFRLNDGVPATIPEDSFLEEALVYAKSMELK